MGLFKKKTVTKTYDKENKKPVIKASICNGEQEGTEDSGKTVPLCGFSCERKVEQGCRTGREDNEVQTR